MKKKDGYDFSLGFDHQNVVSSIIEGRLVPRDLMEFPDAQGGTQGAYVYVDDNGVPRKIDLASIAAGNLTEDLVVTRGVGGYFEGDVIPAGTNLKEIIIQMLHPEVPVGESYVYWFVGNEIPDEVDDTWDKEEASGSIIQTGIVHYFTTNKQFIAFAYDRAYGELKHVYQNDLTMFDLLPDFKKKEVEFEGKTLLMYYVEEKLQGENDKYEFLWN